MWLAVPLAELLSCLLSVWFLRRKRADFASAVGISPDTVDAAADGPDERSHYKSPRRNAPKPHYTFKKVIMPFFRILRSSSFW